MALKKILHLPHTVACHRDARAIAGLLAQTALAETAVGAAIAEMLRQRASDCRDLFALRNVRPRRATLMVMAARALAHDPAAALSLDRSTGGHGAALLRLVAVLVERRLAPEALWTLAVTLPAAASTAPTSEAIPARVLDQPRLQLLSSPAVRTGRPDASFAPERLAA
jgi:hypothetical protein